MLPMARRSASNLAAVDNGATSDLTFEDLRRDIRHVRQGPHFGHGVEFLQRQRFFGEKASLDEMNAFKSKVRK